MLNIDDASFQIHSLADIVQVREENTAQTICASNVNTGGD